MTTKECTMCKEIFPLDNFYLLGNGKYRPNCKPCCRETCKRYKANNKAKISDYNKQYKEENKESISEYNQRYNIEHRSEIQTRHTAYLKQRRHTNPAYKLRVNVMNRMKATLKGTRKCNKTLELLQCSVIQLKEWLEYQLTGTMTMENHGTIWHIDHVIPCSSFELTIPSEQELCFHWSNLQPLLSKDNLSKKDKIIPDEINKHYKKARSFLTLKQDPKLTLILYDRLLLNCDSDVAAAFVNRKGYSNKVNDRIIRNQASQEEEGSTR